MAGDQPPGILQAGAALEARLEQIARLADQGQKHGEGERQDESGRAGERSTDHADQPRPRHATGEAGPGLARADPRRKPRAAEPAADEIGGGIGGPDDGEEPKGQGEPGVLRLAQPDQGQGRQAEIEDSQRRPRGREALEAGVSRVILADGRRQRPVRRALAGSGTTITGGASGERVAIL